MSTLPTDNGLEGPQNRSVFESLPTEILLNIVCNITDLASLDSLIRASPRVNSAFDRFAVEITNAVLSSGYTHDDTKALILEITDIRSSRFRIGDLREFKLFMSQPLLVVSGREESQASPTLPRDTDPKIIRTVLATARRLTGMTLDCLEFYLRSLTSTRPQMLVDTTFKFWSHTHTVDGNIYVPAFKEKHTGRPVPVRDIDPFTWEEMQRVYRAFWRLQLIYDVKLAAIKGRLPWTSEDHRILQRSYGPDLFRRHPVHVQEEVKEFRSVADYIGLGYGPDRMRHFHSLLKQEIVCTPAPCFSELERAYTLPAPGQHDHVKLCSASPGLQFWTRNRRTALPDTQPWTYSPLSLIGFEYFQEFGFAFWSAERLRARACLPPDNQEAHRLLAGNSPDYGRDHEVFYTWLSILTPQQLDIVDV